MFYIVELALLLPSLSAMTTMAIPEIRTDAAGRAMTRVKVEASKPYPSGRFAVPQ